MISPQTHSLVVLSAERIQYLTQKQIIDLVDYFDPDSALFIPDGTGPHVVSQTKFEVDKALPEDVILRTLDGDRPETVITDVGTLLFVPQSISQTEVAKLLSSGREETFVFTNTVSVSMNMQELSASINGLAPFQGHDNSFTVFSAELDADYWVNRMGTTIRGLAPVRTSNTKIPCITLGADGIVTTKTLAEEKLGIRALSGMGDTYAKRFRQVGYETIEDIHEASLLDIKQIEGVGNQRATKFKKHAEALTEGEIVRFDDDDPLPKDVVHIDIETDGLTPSIIWQIGLYDPRNDEFQTFLQKDASEKAPILREFGSWLKSNLDGRAIVAYNGWKFDFEHLEEFFLQYCPEYYDTWHYAHKVDPYDWVSRENNAALPSRGGGLDEVAEALGYEREDTGLDGAATGRAYQRWMENPCKETELDWERHKTYCREDVLALQHVYECLLDSSRLLAEQNTNRPTDENTTQGSLLDY